MTSQAAILTHTFNEKLEKTPLDVAARVLGQEAAGILELQKSLGSEFNEAVQHIFQTKGRVIISGMGKCSHIANKIAATFASTGQPAFFVHPAEASHGDLGMITEDDLVIMLSNSGETSELANLIAYTRRFSIPLIAIVGRKNSTLSKIATVALVLPPCEEACPMGLAPTTSTTMMLALGDALAISLLTQKGFTAQDFKIFHPGGNLGSQLMRVAEKMHKGDALPLIQMHHLMAEAIITMTAKGFGCVGVVDNQGKLQGVLTDGDLRRHMNPGLLDQTAETIMTRDPATITSDMLMVEALSLMNRRGITSLFIVDEMDHPIGLIHIHDFLRAGII